MPWGAGSSRLSCGRSEGVTRDRAVVVGLNRPNVAGGPSGRATGEYERMIRIEDVKAISFDGDGTLWDFEAAMRQALSVALAELRRRLPGPRSGGLTVDRMIGIRNRVADELRLQGVTHEEIRLRAFERTVALVAGRERGLAEDLYALYMRHRFEGIALYPDVIPTLDALRGDLTIGFLSNGNSYPDRCGLEGHFDFVVLSQEVGVAKPDVGFFRIACERAGCTPGELVHVGDSLEEDVVGANGVGATSVWLNREGRDNDSEIVPDYEIRSLSYVADILHRDDRAAPGAGRR